MDDAHASIFADAASLEEYCRDVRARLEQRAGEQTGLLSSRLDSLESLRRTAHALGDRELEAELARHVERIRARQSELGQLLEGGEPIVVAPPPETAPEQPSVNAPSADSADSWPVASIDAPTPSVSEPAGADIAPEALPEVQSPPEPVSAEGERAPAPEPVAAATPSGNEPEPLPAEADSVPSPEPASLWASPAPAPAPPWAPLPPAAMAPAPAWQAGVEEAAPPAPAPNPDMPWLPASPVIAEPAPAPSIEDNAWAELAAQAATVRSTPPSAPAWGSVEPDRSAEPPAAPPPNWDTNFAVPSSATDPEMGGLCLEVSVGDREWTWRMAGDSAVIGRATPGTSIMPDLDLWPDQTVSRRHLEVVAREGRYFVTDQASANGSLLNDSPLPPNVETEIRPGDQLRLGAASHLKVAGV